MGYYPQESLYKPYKYHGYTVRGTPNCPLITDDATYFMNKIGGMWMGLPPSPQHYIFLKHPQQLPGIFPQL